MYSHHSEVTLAIAQRKRQYCVTEAASVSPSFVNHHKNYSACNAALLCRH